MLFTQECVCQDNELSHDRGDGDFGWLSGFSQSVVFCLEIGIEAGGDECRHVERLPDDGPSTDDEGASGSSPGLLVAWRKARELANGLLIEFTQFRHLDEKGKGCDLRKTGYGNQDIEACLEAIVDRNPIGDDLLDLGELRFNLRQAGSVLPFEKRLGDVPAPVLRNRPCPSPAPSVRHATP